MQTNCPKCGQRAIACQQSQTRSG
ncbi:hypothetical protein [Pigmentiphaga sp.]